eukprot:5613098-Amphidinium_carterae.3
MHQVSNEYQTVDDLRDDEVDEDGLVTITNMHVDNMEGQLGTMLSLTDEPSTLSSMYDMIEKEAEKKIPMKSKRQHFQKSGVRSQLYGAYAKQGCGITSESWSSCELVSCVHHLVRTCMPNLAYTSFVVKSIELLRGRCCSDGTQGQNQLARLWQFDTQGQVEPPCEARDLMPPHAKGKLTSTYHEWVRLRGEGWHAVEAPTQGRRWSISVFTPQSIQRLSHEHWSQLEQLGFPIAKLRNLHCAGELRELRTELHLAQH